MRIVLCVVALAQVAFCGVSIRMPYLSPAGVTFVDGAQHTGLQAGALAYTTATARPFVAPSPYAAYGVKAYQTPVAYQPAVAAYQPAVAAYQPAVAAYHAPAVAYQPVTKYAAVPTVHHVQSHADVPVTRYEAHPAVIQKAVDVAKPAIKTRKYEIRRPAIQKQFYDIEERTIVRQAGSALLELEQPLSKSQKGEAVISPAAYAVPYVQKYAVPAVHSVAAIPAYARLQPFAYSPLATVPAHYKVFQSQLASAQPATPNQPQLNQEQSTETPQESEPTESAPAPAPQPQEQPQSDDDDTVSVENADFSSRSAAPEPSAMPAEQESSPTESESSSAPAPENSEQPQSRSAGVSPLGYSSSIFDLIPQGRSGPSVVPSLRNLSPDVNQANQQRLIQLLTANGGVTEVGLGRSGPSSSPVGESGQIRGRVLSATPAPPTAEPTGERVNTRRVVISRPIETVQEIEVQEPITKLHRIHVNQPTFIKTARQELVRVPTSVPVYGKALAPVAHAAVPVAHAALPVAHAYSPYYG